MYWCKTNVFTIEIKDMLCYNFRRVSKGGDKMKESAGEANMTVITIVLIGLVAAAGAILIPNLLSGMSKKGCCSSYGGVWESNTCKSVSSNGTKSDISENLYWNSSKKACTKAAGGND